MVDCTRSWRLDSVFRIFDTSPASCSSSSFPCSPAVICCPTVWSSWFANIILESASLDQRVQSDEAACASTLLECSHERSLSANCSQLCQMLPILAGKFSTSDKSESPQPGVYVGIISWISVQLF